MKKDTSILNEKIEDRYWIINMFNSKFLAIN